MIVSAVTKYVKLLLFLVGIDRSILGLQLLVVIAEQKNYNNNKNNKKPQHKTLKNQTLVR